MFWNRVGKTCVCIFNRRNEDVLYPLLNVNTQYTRVWIQWDFITCNAQYKYTSVNRLRNHRPHISITPQIIMFILFSSGWKLHSNSQYAYIANYLHYLLILHLYPTISVFFFWKLWSSKCLNIVLYSVVYSYTYQSELCQGKRVLYITHFYLNWIDWTFLSSFVTKPYNTSTLAQSALMYVTVQWELLSCSSDGSDALVSLKNISPCSVYCTVQIYTICFICLPLTSSTGSVRG